MQATQFNWSLTSSRASWAKPRKDSNTPIIVIRCRMFSVSVTINNDKHTYFNITNYKSTVTADAVAIAHNDNNNINIGPTNSKIDNCNQPSYY